MANLKNITELPVAESADGLNLIVNDNGAAKQIPANIVGAQADWAETDETSPAFVKNKPVEEWDLDITVNTSFDDDGSFIFTPIINYGVFDVIKNKILNNESVKIKSQIVCSSPEDTSIVGYENLVIYSMAYAPQNLFGSDGNPEMIGLLGHSMIADRILFYTILPDNSIMVGEY